MLPDRDAAHCRLIRDDFPDRPVLFLLALFDVPGPVFAQKYEQFHKQWSKKSHSNEWLKGKSV
ncbi:hypothetical protein ALP36_00896 [Pseudomonas syringae pv. coriandricola]|uniref:Uncharacterized protein n=1 Tax=Pseudomonas syringae pv. coriandricola TaxID=264453 RepID=A0A3M5RC45_9PSED|nr:hypothetical protein ALP87_00457 [Pseudomonas syringae pv. coriandricola]RMU06540.1 hypothetical protein ALP36_00896 [Pseudomonas syringae pv. coriandricola]